MNKLREIKKCQVWSAAAVDAQLVWCLDGLVYMFCHAHVYTLSPRTHTYTYAYAGAFASKKHCPGPVPKHHTLQFHSPSFCLASGLGLIIVICRSVMTGIHVLHEKWVQSIQLDLVTALERMSMNVLYDFKSTFFWILHQQDFLNCFDVLHFDVCSCQESFTDNAWARSCTEFYADRIVCFLTCRVACKV